MQMHSWLRRIPVPSMLRLDGKRQIVIGAGKNKWKDCILNLEAMQPSLVEALDAEGNVLRATNLGGEGSEAVSEEQAKSERKHTELAELAGVILEATDRGAKRHADAYELAFSKMTELVTILASRMSALEAAWQGALDTIAAQKSEGGGDGDVGGALVQMIAGAAQAQAEPRKVAKK